MGAACFGQHYTQTNLVSNASGVAPVTDPQLINPWGISRGSGSPWWVSDNATGFSTLYDGAGAKQSLIVTIPPADPNNKKTPTGTPTGTIFNGSQTDSLLAPAKPALFLFSTNDGTIAGWNPAVAATIAVTVVKTTDGSSDTGLTSASINGKPFLYAANFNKGRVDVYDNAFRPVKLTGEHSDRNSGDDDDRSSENSFVDENLPRGYVPFNVQAIANDIVVTYALHEEDARFETDGPGLGFVDIYSSTGRLLLRSISDASATTCSSGSSRVAGTPNRADSSPLTIWLRENSTDCSRMLAGRHWPSMASGHSALEMSARIIMTPQPHPPQRCTSRPDRTTAREVCLVIWRRFLRN
jgi:uncharacterized protein (TIGR03118 family)